MILKASAANGTLSLASRLASSLLSGSRVL